MSQEMINLMVATVEEGYTPRSAWESSLTFSPGSTVKVNKSTTGTDPNSGASFTIPEGETVTVLGVGGGTSGVDHHVVLKDGRQAIVPFYDLGEASLVRARGQSRCVQESDLVGAVLKVTLTKPLPQSAIEWLKGGYYDYGVELPMTPQADSGTATTFLMKAEDEETLQSAVEALKKLAGASFKSAADATLTDWVDA